MENPAEVTTKTQRRDGTACRAVCRPAPVLDRGSRRAGDIPTNPEKMISFGAERQVRSEARSEFRLIALPPLPRMVASFSHG